MNFQNYQLLFTQEVLSVNAQEISFNWKYLPDDSNPNTDLNRLFYLKNEQNVTDIESH